MEGPVVLAFEREVQARDCTEEACLMRNILNKENEIIKSTSRKLNSEKLT